MAILSSARVANYKSQFGVERATRNYRRTIKEEEEEDRGEKRKGGGKTRRRQRSVMEVNEGKSSAKGRKGKRRGEERRAFVCPLEGEISSELVESR